MSERKYSVIVSDLGNVILPFNYETAINKLELVEKGLGHQFYDFLKSHYSIHRKFERGDIAQEEFIRIMLSALDNKVSAEEFCNIYAKIFTLNEPLISLLAKLQKDYILILLSNTNKIHRDYGWGNYPFLKYFDKLILSYEVHAVKPEPEVYKAVEKFTKKPPEEHIFIDDIAEYAKGAKCMGWDAIQYINFKQLEEDLSGKGII
ncbi:MAG: HAD family phosphatase [Ignavibacteriaceae bacterium]|nr:HAD family phosphatase [Ignavibacteriaceae bacterium]